MKLPKAIEILSLGLPADTWKLEPDLKDAIKLGIEALKRLEEARTLSPLFGIRKLPGETQ